MTVLRLLIDNDIVIKLAQMNAYVDGVSSIDVTPTEIGSLGVMLRYMGQLSAERRRKITTSTAEADRLHKALLSIQEIEPTLDEQLLAAGLMKVIIQNELDMDEGEVALIAVAIKRPEVNVATGDKRALRSLSSLEQKHPGLRVMRERFICFEQIFKRLCQKKGLPRVRAAVLAARHADKTITTAYDALASQGAQAFVNGMNVVTADRITNIAPGWLKRI